MVILKGLKFVTLHYNMQLKKALKIFSVFLVYSLSFFNIILDLLTVLLLLLLVVISVLKIHPIFFFFFGLIHRFFYKTLQDIVSYFKLNISDTDISLFTYVIFVIFLAFFAYFFIFCIYIKIKVSF